MRRPDLRWSGRATAVVNKYLRVHAEPGTTALARLPRERRGVVVVPTRAESAACWSGLSAACQRGSALAIVVINNRLDDGPDVRATNEVSWHALLELGSATQLAADVVHVDLGDAGLLLVDRFRGGRALPPDQGVGLARKIGADLALTLIAGGAVHDGFIRFADADVSLPSDYFDRGTDLRAVAFAYPFWHAYRPEAKVRASGKLERATAWYEVWLRHYVVGLARARSPYAFHTIGSCMAVEASAYAKVRGVPKRRAAEDFHLLAKLAKLGAIVRPEGEPIIIEPRLSDRVVFGTGASTARLVERLGRGECLQLYHPRTFELLAAALRWLSRASDAGGVPDPVSADERLAVQLLARREVASRLPQAWTGTTTAHQRWGRTLEWFDALQTRRFVHACRDVGFPDVDWRECLGTWLTDVPDDATTVRRVLQSMEPTVGGLRTPSHRAGTPSAGGSLRGASQRADLRRR